MQQLSCEFPDAQADAEHALWRQWRDDRSETARNELAAMHAGYARVVAAAYYAKRCHNEIEYPEYAQLAHLALLEAIERFDPAFGVQFKTFAARRMHGAILDGLERLTEKQQQIAAERRLKAQRSRSLADADDGKAPPAGRTPEQALQFVSDIGVGLALAWLLEGTGMVDSGERFEVVPFYRSAELRQLRERLLEAIDKLPPQQAKVISAHYLQEVPFEEIASLLGLSRGRVSQIHKRALLSLRGALRAPPRLRASY